MERTYSVFGFPDAVVVLACVGIFPVAYVLTAPLWSCVLGLLGCPVWLRRGQYRTAKYDVESVDFVLRTDSGHRFLVCAAGQVVHTQLTLFGEYENERDLVCGPRVARPPFEALPVERVRLRPRSCCERTRVAVRAFFCRSRDWQEVVYVGSRVDVLGRVDDPEGVMGQEAAAADDGEGHGGSLLGGAGRGRGNASSAAFVPTAAAASANALASSSSSSSSAPAGAGVALLAAPDDRTAPRSAGLAHEASAGVGAVPRVRIMPLQPDDPDALTPRRCVCGLVPLPGLRRAGLVVLNRRPVREQVDRLRHRAPPPPAADSTAARVVRQSCCAHCNTLWRNARGHTALCLLLSGSVGALAGLFTFWLHVYAFAVAFAVSTLVFLTWVRVVSIRVRWARLELLREGDTLVEDVVHDLMVRLSGVVEAVVVRDHPGGVGAGGGGGNPFASRSCDPSFQPVVVARLAQIRECGCLDSCCWSTLA